ncbi:MAG: hypothetical protein VX433_03025 [Candidatus Thermoplasmatota archaeon]|nr:hypothetical protein [Candidatus Thermoplasmatota archaeon]
MADGGVSEMIMLVASLLVAGIVSGVLVGSYANIVDGMEGTASQSDVNSKTNSGLVSDPMNIDWNTLTNQTTISVQNTGQLTLDIDETSMILNGSSMNVTKSGGPTEWVSGTVISFTVSGNVSFSNNQEVTLIVIVNSETKSPATGVHSFTEVVRIV